MQEEKKENEQWKKLRECAEKKVGNGQWNIKKASIARILKDFHNGNTANMEEKIGRNKISNQN